MLGASYWPRARRDTCTNALVNHYLTRDGQRFLLCCVDAPKDWPNFCRAIGREELIDDPRFSTLQARVEHAETLIALIDHAVAAKDLDQWAALFREYDILWGRVPDLAAVANDPQMHAAGVFPQLEHPDYGTIHTVASPIELDGADKVPPAAAPRLGEHSRRILQDLGYDQETVEAMLLCGATAAPEAT
jgi:crotonobetainyl-CoA:carnitine CoA-transferase CaiB-like acyl-CoA transferase